MSDTELMEEEKNVIYWLYKTDSRLQLIKEEKNAIKNQLNLDTKFIAEGGEGDIFYSVKTNESGKKTREVIKVDRRWTDEKSLKKRCEINKMLSDTKKTLKTKIGMLNLGDEKISYEVPYEISKYKGKNLKTLTNLKMPIEKEGEIDGYLDEIDGYLNLMTMLESAIPLSFLHLKGIAHRDIKPENFLLKKKYIEHNNHNNWKFNTKLCDFAQSEKVFNNNIYDSWGTRGYKPIEVFDGEVVGNNLFPADVYSFGATMAFMLGYEPKDKYWGGGDRNKYIEQLNERLAYLESLKRQENKDKVRLPDEIKNNKEIYDNFIDLVILTLSDKPEERPNIIDVLKILDKLRHYVRCELNKKQKNSNEASEKKEIDNIQKKLRLKKKEKALVEELTTTQLPVIPNDPSDLIDNDNDNKLSTQQNELDDLSKYHQFLSNGSHASENLILGKKLENLSDSSFKCEEYNKGQNQKDSNMLLKSNS